MRLPAVDLNLFLVFEAVYAERNLTRAANILHVTQPAVSNALKRLREAFEDPLFVRTPRGVAPTPLADDIAPRISEALNLLRLSLSEGTEFAPGTARRTFAISLNESDQAILLPRLMQRLATEAPDVAVECFAIRRGDLEAELAGGTIDLAVDVPLFSVPQLCRHRLQANRYVCVVRQAHPAVAGPLDLEGYLRLGHLHVSSRRGGIGHVDRALERIGRQRDIRLRMNSYLAAPQVVASSDLALTVPGKLAQMYDLEILELPFEVEPLEQHLYWHRNADQDRANRWLRNVLLTLTDPESGGPGSE